MQAKRCKAFWSVVVLLGLASSVAHAAVPHKQLAVTIDDLDLNGDDSTRMSLEQRNEAVLGTLHRLHLQAAVFACGMRVDNDGGRRHLTAWSEQGHIIANHTYSHFNYPEVGFDKFSMDALRGEEVIRGYTGFKSFSDFPISRKERLLSSAIKCKPS